MKPVLCLIPGILAAATAISAPVEFHSSEHRTALVELFTSEGCSSCPPAESWLSRLKAAPGLWSDFVPIAFHVDYWDYLGWRDKWGDRQFSDRQRAYARAWGLASTYTPGLVLNGSEWRGWSPRTVLPAIGGGKPGVLKVTSEDTSHWHVYFAPEKPETASYVVNAALLVGNLVSEVKAGENAGRQLGHDFVVLALQEQPLTRQQDTFQGMFTINAKLNPTNGSPALAVWITRTARMEPVQATGGWLTGPNRK